MTLFTCTVLFLQFVQTAHNKRYFLVHSFFYFMIMIMIK